jgi:hypothetical protein
LHSPTIASALANPAFRNDKLKIIHISFPISIHHHPNSTTVIEHFQTNIGVTSGHPNDALHYSQSQYLPSRVITRRIIYLFSSLSSARIKFPKTFVDRTKDQVLVWALGRTARVSTANELRAHRVSFENQELW